MKTIYPKIGIRPTIDGRQGGIREGLEEKTMNLAKAVKNLIESTLKNGDGSPVSASSVTRRLVVWARVQPVPRSSSARVWARPLP